MRTYKKQQIGKAVILFCRLVKMGYGCSAKSLDLNFRQAQLLRIVLSSRFSRRSGAPLDFPRLFICDDKERHYFHKNSTPNNIDLSDTNTIEDIISLMSYVNASLKSKAKVEKVDDSSIIDFSLPHKLEVLEKKGKEIILKVIFV